MKFRYKGGELFSFTGDDDLWVFVNDRLAIDLGGLHSAQTDVIDLDARAVELGIELGNEYALDLFHAERHTKASKFMVQSTLEFTNCDPIVY
jgi:fibro-slime domain-containing protein